MSARAYAAEATSPSLGIRAPSGAQGIPVNASTRTRSSRASSRAVCPFRVAAAPTESTSRRRPASPISASSTATSACGRTAAMARAARSHQSGVGTAGSLPMACVRAEQLSSMCCMRSNSVCEVMLAVSVCIYACSLAYTLKQKNFDTLQESQKFSGQRTRGKHGCVVTRTHYWAAGTLSRVYSVKTHRFRRSGVRANLRRKKAHDANTWARKHWMHDVSRPSE